MGKVFGELRARALGHDNVLPVGHLQLGRVKLVQVEDVHRLKLTEAETYEFESWSSEGSTCRPGF